MCTKDPGGGLTAKRNRVTVHVLCKSCNVTEDLGPLGTSHLVGGALSAVSECNITLTNSTFSSNKAKSDKTLDISKTSNIELAAHAADKNKIGIHLFINPILFNHTPSHDKNLKLIAAHKTLPIKSSMLNKKSNTSQEDLLPSVGGAIYVALQSRLFVTNCVFDDNSAQFFAGVIAATANVKLGIQHTYFTCNSATMQGGAILAKDNVTLDLQETVFVGNKAFSDGGAINIQHQVHLRMTNCLFDDNISGRVGGAFCAGLNTTIQIQETNFTRNRADQGGAIDVDMYSYLRITNCTFEDNRANHGGAIFGGFDLICEIIGSQFLKNSASQQGGAINVQTNANLLITNSRLERNFIDTDTGGRIVLAFNVKSNIRETNFTGNSAPNTAGALMVYSQTDCHVEWCIFHSNTANTVGGAVVISIRSSLRIENTNFTNNNSTDGGAIGIDVNCKLHTEMCNYWENVAKQTGGAITLSGGATAIIESCLFLSNHAVNGGAVNINPAHDPFVRATFFFRNVASDRGGAITINGAANAIIDNITCVGNQSPRGGCLYIDSVTLTLNNSNISENFGYELGAGILADYSRMQVGFAFPML